MIEYVKQNIKRQSLHDDTHFRHFSNTFSWAFVDFSLIFWYFCHFVVIFVHRRALLHISYNKTHIKVVLFFQFHTTGGAKSSCAVNEIIVKCSILDAALRKSQGSRPRIFELICQNIRVITNRLGDI